MKSFTVALLLLALVGSIAGASKKFSPKVIYRMDDSAEDSDEVQDDEFSDDSTEDDVPGEGYEEMFPGPPEDANYPSQDLGYGSQSSQSYGSQPSQDIGYGSQSSQDIGYGYQGSQQQQPQQGYSFGFSPSLRRRNEPVVRRRPSLGPLRIFRRRFRDDDESEEEEDEEDFNDDVVHSDIQYGPGTKSSNLRSYPFFFGTAGRGRSSAPVSRRVTHGGSRAPMTKTPTRMSMPPVNYVPRPSMYNDRNVNSVQLAPMPYRRAQIQRVYPNRRVSSSPSMAMQGPFVVRRQSHRPMSYNRRPNMPVRQSYTPMRHMPMRYNMQGSSPSSTYMNHVPMQYFSPSRRQGQGSYGRFRY